MNELIIILFNSIVILFSLLIFFFIYLIVKGKQKETFERNKERYINENQDAWYTYLVGDSEELAHTKPYQPFEIEAIEEIFTSYLQGASDQKVKNRIRTFASQNLQEGYRKQLKSSNWGTRMNTLYRIGNFRMDELFNECKKMSMKKISKEEYFEIVILASYFDIDFFIQELISAKVVFSEYEYKKIFFGISPTAELELEQQFSLLSFTSQLAYIDTLGLKRYARSLPFLEAQLNQEQSEIRIRSLKAINEIGILTDVKKIEPFINSSIWEERLMSARLLGKLPSTIILTYLSELIEDQNWWVRAQAAETILHSENGKENLQQIALSSTDAFAVDIANELLKEGV